MLKTDSAIIVTDRLGHALASVAAPPGSALFAFSANGVPALVYFEQTNTLCGGTARTLQSERPACSIHGGDGSAIDRGSESSLVTFIVERKDGLWELHVRTATGQVESQTALAGAACPVLMLASNDLLYTDANGVVIRRQDGSEKHIAAQLPKSFAFQQMGEGWVEVTDLESGRLFAINIHARARAIVRPAGGAAMISRMFLFGAALTAVGVGAASGFLVRWHERNPGGRGSRRGHRTPGDTLDDPIPGPQSRLGTGCCSAGLSLAGSRLHVLGRAFAPLYNRAIHGIARLRS